MFLFGFPVCSEWVKRSTWASNDKPFSRAKIGSCGLKFRIVFDFKKGLNRGLAGLACSRPRGPEARILKAPFPPLKTPIEGNYDGRGGSSADRVALHRLSIYLYEIFTITGIHAARFRPSKNTKKRLVIRVVECYHDQAISLSGSAKTFSTVVEIPVEK